jgi:hypothetical protein
LIKSSWSLVYGEDDAPLFAGDSMGSSWGVDDQSSRAGAFVFVALPAMEHKNVFVAGVLVPAYFATWLEPDEGSRRAADSIPVEAIDFSADGKGFPRNPLLPTGDGE